MLNALHQRSDRLAELGLTDRPEGNTRLRAGLKLLLDGYIYSRELERDRWEFALEIGFLHMAGTNNNDLRWLVNKGYAEYGLEVTAKRKVRRVAHRDGRLVLPNGTCFVLTDSGVEFTREMLSPSELVTPRNAAGGRSMDCLLEEDHRPYWDRETHTLYWRDRPVKHFKHEAPFQEAILEAFHSSNWVQCVIMIAQIADGVDSKQRLHEAVKNLNRSCSGVLRFTQEGNGERVAWQALV